MNNMIQEMLGKYNCTTKEEYINAFKEIVQEVALYSLSLTDFFDKASFYGGTALRIFYNLDRFSENLDFSLNIKDDNFNIEKYFSSLTKTFEILGLNFIPQIKEKTKDSNIQSAFLKGNTLEHILLVNPKNDISKHIQKNEIIKIKFEVDTNPPEGATYEYKYQLFPLPCKIKIYDESSLFAGKVHAVLCRNWNKRIKGRDLYDFEFYIKNGCLLNLEHLKQRMLQTGHLKENDLLSIEKIKELLKLKFKEIDFEQAKDDVLPFVNNVSRLNMWNIGYFNYLADRIISNEVEIYERNFDISTYGIANLLDEKMVERISYSNKEKKTKAFNNIKLLFNKYIICDDDILNFGNKVNVEERCFVIERFSEKIYLKETVDIKKVIEVLKRN